MTSMVTEEAPAGLSHSPAPAAAPLTAGAALQAVRRAKGLHIAALAAMLKVPQAKLEALEADRLGDLPDATFARALATAMCRALKADPAPVLALLPKGNEPGLDRVTRGLNQPFRDRAGRDDGLAADWLKRPVVLSAGGLLLAAALVYSVPGAWLTALTERFEAAAPAAQTPAPESVEPAPELAAQTQTVAKPAEQPASAPLLVAAPAPMATASTSPAAAPSATDASVLAPSLPPLRIRTSADSWVEVVDAKGQVLLSRVLRAGEQAELAGQVPLKLRIGNVSGTELNYKGAPVDLLAQARDNVARLELN